MSAETRHSPLEAFLGRVRPHLPLRQARDILLELESTIRDRVDDLAEQMGREPDDELFAMVCSEMGEPEEVASGYVAERYLIGPDAYRPFLLYTGVLFALHMVLIGVATAMNHALTLGPFVIAPLGHEGILSMLTSALAALFIDIGIMVVTFTALGSVKRFTLGGGTNLRVECRPRVAYGSALMSILVALVLNYFRDGIFVVVAEGLHHPLFTEAFLGKLPVVTAILVLAAAKDVFYGVAGERRLTLATDALHGVLGVAAMLYLLRGDPLLALPAIESFHAFHGAVNAFLGELSDLVVAFMAAIFAVKTVKRLWRIGQI